MHSGMVHTFAPVVCFLDADLKRITRQHLLDLVLPVTSGRVQATIAIFVGSLRPTVLAQAINPKVTGQRCLQRRLLEDFDQWHCRFEIETLLESHLKKKGVPRIIIRWDKASQVTKEEKLGPIRGPIARWGMWRDMVVASVKTRLDR